MIFDPSNWELVKTLLENKRELLLEFSASRDAVKSKVNMTTPDNHKLFDKPMGILPYTLDPSLWTAEERANANVTSLNQRWPDYAPPLGIDIAKQFPAIRQFYWTSLTPGGNVLPHWGINGKIQNRIPDHWRIQICWLPGNGVTFHLLDEKIEYVEDLVFGFNDGLDYHWVEHNGTTERTTIIIDVWRNQVEEANVPHPSAIRKN